MIQHTQKNLDQIDDNLKKDDLYYKEDKELNTESKKNKDELVEQRESTVSFLTEEFRVKASLEDSKSDTLMPNENKRSQDTNTEVENKKKRKA